MLVGNWCWVGTHCVHMLRSQIDIIFVKALRTQSNTEVAVFLCLMQCFFVSVCIHVYLTVNVCLCMHVFVYLCIQVLYVRITSC